MYLSRALVFQILVVAPAHYINRTFKYDIPGSTTSTPTGSTSASPAAPAATRSGVKC